MTATAVADSSRLTLPATWLEANQRYLCAEFARLETLVRAHLEGTGAAPEADHRVTAVGEARGAMPSEPAIDVVAGVFGLSPFERDILLLAAGVEMSASLADACARSGGFPGSAAFSTALAALPDPHWTALAPAGPLRRWRLIELLERSSFVTSALRIDERILHYLAGLNDLDPRVRPLVRVIRPAPLMAPSHHRTASAIVRVLGTARGSEPLVQLFGTDADGQEDVAARVAGACGCVLYAIDADDVPRTNADRLALETLWGRESALLGAALVVVASRGTAADRACTEFLDDIPGLVFQIGREPVACRRPSIEFAVNHPTVADRRQLWHEALADSDAPRVDVDMIAGHYRMSARAVVRAGKAASQAIARGDDSRTLVRIASRSGSHSALGQLAQHITPSSGWDSLVVPDDVMDALRAVAAQVRHRTTVHDTWGLGPDGTRGLGITALFSGESGTGKTMAAEVLAGELALELYRIDLATVVSKYIGETEKNLSRAFDAGEESGAMLLFDEADALFGKRSDVKDSHDRYANVEINYLLQRMESYNGLAILTTNMKSALDRAFHRRLRFVIQFPFPGAEQRERIWRSVFPAATPTGALDFGRLARLNVSGGGIRNIAVNAAFRAVAASEPVGMTHLLAAARSEFAKQDRSLTDAEVRGWA
jgi:hypothetical protein